MRCNIVIRQINEKLPINRDMQKHIQNCPACARMVKGAGLINDAFSVAKKINNEIATPFSDIRKRVESKVETQKENLMSTIKNSMIRRPKLLAGLSLAVLAFLFVTLVPMSYTTTVGYELVCADLPDEINISTQRLFDAFRALGHDDLTITFENNNCTIGGIQNKQAAHEISIAFSSLTGLTTDYEIRPIIGMASGSLYAQVVNKYKVEVDLSGKSDTEIAEEVRQQLIESGFTTADVTVTTMSEGMVKINITGSTVDADGETQSEAVIELIMDGGGEGNFSFDAPQVGIKLDTEGMTEAEIKAAIEAKLAAEGKEGAVVEVITRPDGRREIKVSIEKEVIK